MTERHVDLFATAAHLEADAERLHQLELRLAKLVRQQERTGESWSVDWPDEIQIQIADLDDAMAAATAAFESGLPFYPDQAKAWRGWRDYYREGDLTSANLVREYRDKVAILRRCARIVRARAEAMAPAAGPAPIYSYGSLIMGDSYSAEQAGAMGPNAHAHDMTFNRVTGGDAASLTDLARQLAEVRQAMKKSATDDEHDVAIGQVAQAEVAAKAGKESGVLAALSGAGSWALKVAQDVGAKLAVAALEQAMKR